MPWVVGFVLLLTFVTMVMIFRSIAVALSAILLNLLSAAAAFGVLVAVFQNTWAEGFLDFHSSGAVVSWLPLFLFVVLFGLSMDYHVFVVSRIPPRQPSRAPRPRPPSVRASPAPRAWSPAPRSSWSESSRSSAP
ncbi:MMPL family transporter OS=Streptomyces tendae OX=1932 GN=GUR47_35305 PE=4 SV=1 [Streptomyces tendae]